MRTRLFPISKKHRDIARNYAEQNNSDPFAYKRCLSRFQVFGEVAIEVDGNGKITLDI